MEHYWKNALLYPKRAGSVLPLNDDGLLLTPTQFATHGFKESTILEPHQINRMLRTEAVNHIL